ncbi:MAG: hypothetical protein E7406_04595 [Ruminococcaceae bacterium]|nr:hypothetical protein [Oscillospiraceae bacterium]
MKNRKWIPILLFAAALYFLVCAIDIVVYKYRLIPHFGFHEYSFTEKAFISFLYFIPMFISIFLFKKDNAKKFIIDIGLFWLLHLVLSALINIPEWASLHISGFETFVYEVNPSRQEIWFKPYFGVFCGMIIAGVISNLKYRKNMKQDINLPLKETL